LRARTLTPAEYSAYSGIGAVVCISDGLIRTATAFLVGRFDTAVTVGHVFMSGRDWLAAYQCAYTNPGPRGQIRERIPVVSINAQWELEPETLGQPQDDLAVVRLAAPVKWARRTMPFTRFAHTHAPVVLVGFRADLAADTLKRKSLGRVYPRPDNSCLRFTHDVDSMRFSSGAPPIDIRDGVVLGLHARLLRSTSSGCASQGNAMILMNDWLETTLRAEIASATLEGPGRRGTFPTPTAR
jgi:Trypsin-like peptidase domain